MMAGRVSRSGIDGGVGVGGLEEGVEGGGGRQRDHS